MITDIVLSKYMQRIDNFNLLFAYSIYNAVDILSNNFYWKIVTFSTKEERKELPKKTEKTYRTFTTCVLYFRVWQMIGFEWLLSFSFTFKRTWAIINIMSTQSKSQNGRRHAKKALMAWVDVIPKECPAHPSFGMTTAFRSYILWSQQSQIPKSWCHTKRRMGARKHVPICLFMTTQAIRWLLHDAA